MAHQAIYRKWRPMIFEDIVGQSHITQTLKNQILTGKVGHAYLFCGTRGTGKTTCAKVFSRAVNCLNNRDGSPCNECEICKGIISGAIMDVTEIDAASNNGVDNIREIKDDVRYVASTARYTVYIIDEVHMLSPGAFNALLKTLEEPPEHVIFILATTEPHKVPQTILSRCQRFDFKRIRPSDIILRMKEIAAGDGFTVTDDAYALLAKLADGSMRDGLSIMERVLSACGDSITEDDIVNTLGISTLDTAFKITDAVINNRADEIIKIIDELVSDGKDLKTFVDSVIKHFRDLLVCSVGGDEKVLDYSAEDMVKIKAQSSKITFEKISNSIKVLSQAQSDAKWIKSPRVIYELAFIKTAKPQTDDSPEALADRVATLEMKVQNGGMSGTDVSGIEERIERLENKVKNGVPAIAADEKQEPKKNPEKKEVSVRLYSPIPKSELNSENPIVVIAKRWNDIVNSICKSQGYLKAPLMDRPITIDNEGIIMLYEEEEREGTKKFAQTFLKKIQSGFKKVSGSDYKIKIAMKNDLDDDNIIDFWSLKPPEGKAEEDLNEKPLDPLEAVAENFGEIVEFTDDSEFKDYEKTDFEQSSFDDNDREEFLDDSELSKEDD